MLSKRLNWVDAARGICVLAILLMHFLIWIYRPELANPTADSRLWERVSGIFGWFRLSLLFAVSGFILSSRVRAGWSDRRNFGQAARTYYLYAVWLVVFALLSLVIPGDAPMQVHGVASFFTQLVLPRTILWFVLALTVYVLVFSALRRVPPAVMLVGLALISYSSIFLPGNNGGDLYIRVVYYAIFFAIGVYLKPAMVYMTTGGVWWKVIVAAGVFYAFRKLYFAVPNEYALRTAVRMLQDAAAIFACIAAIAIICMVPIVARVLSTIGRRTLPIYVLQLPLFWLILSLPGVTELLQVPAVRMVAPALGVALIASASLGIYWGAMKTPLRHLFQMPQPLYERIVRSSSTAPLETSSVKG
jgi:surface polysaccharide O-acyltransferase-like enzyme